VHDPGNAMPRELAALQAFLDRRDEVPRLDDADPPSPENEGYRLLAVADTLVDLARRLKAVGRAGDARTAAFEALALYEVLADIRYEPLAAEAEELARELTPVERAIDLMRIGVEVPDPDHAVRIGEDTVEDFQAFGGSTESRAGLAMALNNLGNHLARAGEVLDAIAAAEEAVAILRELAVPALAWAVANLGRHLRSAGRDEEALAALREAVELLETLADHGEPYAADLARIDAWSGWAHRATGGGAGG
jgi:tetratricopeptide (TPR) repeat protein